ncbi:MAG: carboxymuconolactone decarboxylase family protein [Dehalococcoidales bacterium]|nr:carboxymuconolactone decarboxylase family protein [Dehalococcoidales bacterium]
MPRVSLVEKEQAHPVVRELYEKNEAAGWPVLNLFKVLGHCPHIGLNFQRLGNAILHGEGLSPKLRELAILRVGDLAHSVYEFTKHTEIGKKAGVTSQQIAEISRWATSPAFDEKERVVLAYTDEVAQNIAVKDTTFAALKRFFNEEEIVELTTAIGYYGLVSRILVALQVELES